LKIEFTPSVGTDAVTLGDDAIKFAVVVEQLGANSLVQAEALPRAVNQAVFTRGNVLGEFVFTSSKTYADYGTTFTQFLAEYSRLNQQGTLKLTEGTAILQFLNATLKGVQRIFDTTHCGAHMGIRYTFAITAITAPLS